jgi:hypothetical protein
VEFNGLVHFAFDAISRLARGYAAGEIGRIGRIAGAGFFDDDKVTAHFNPACFRLLFWGAWRKIITGLSRNSDHTFFLVVSILAVTATRSIKIPPVLLDKFDYRANFHRRECLYTKRPRSTSTATVSVLSN